MTSQLTSEPLPNTEYSVGWVCALPKELVAARAMLDREHERLPKKPPSDHNIYIAGSIGQHNVVLACLPKGKIGNNPAVAVATRMISTFPSIKFGLLVGIGGGIPPKVRLGDVVVSIPGDQHPGVVQWDSGKAERGGKFKRTGALNNPPSELLQALSILDCEHKLKGSKIPQYLDDLKKFPNLQSEYIRSGSLKDILFAPDNPHRTVSTTQSVFSGRGADYVTSASNDGSIAGDERQGFGAESDQYEEEEEEEEEEKEEEEEENCRFCDMNKTIKRQPRDMCVHYGLIASGNQVIKDATFRDRLNKSLGGNVLCVEMEAAGLMNDFPCIVIRGICDYADSHKNKDWQEHAAVVAAAYAKELLSIVPAQEVAQMPMIKSISDRLDGISADFKKVLSREHSKEHQVILDWLTPIDYAPQQHDFITRRQAGTGQWLLDSVEFQKWLEISKQTLFCPGIPGAGKTIITSIVVDEVCTKFQNDASIGIAYLYCDFRRQQEQKATDLLASVLKQLVQKQPLTPDNVKSLYQRCKEKRYRPSFEEISKALQSIAADYSKTFIIIDALDECQASNGCRNQLLLDVFNLQTKIGANLFATSRFIPEITKEFERSTVLQIRANDDDVERYLNGKMSRLRSFVSRDLTLQEEIKTEIIKAVDGMFLLAQLYLDSLVDKMTPKAVRCALKCFQKKSDTPDSVSKALDLAYTQAMVRINSQEAGFQEVATQVLSWIICAKRPLTTLELRHALAVEIGMSELDETNLLEIEDMVSVCAGLVTVDEESDIVRLVHYTTQEYLQTHISLLDLRSGPVMTYAQKNNIAMTNTQNDIAMTNTQNHITIICVTYLLFNSFDRGFCPTDKDFEEQLQLYPLYNYAARNWGYHVRTDSAEVKQLILDLLENETKVSAFSQAMMVTDTYRYKDYSQNVPKQMTGTHIAAYFGLKEVLQSLLENGYNPDSKDIYGQTPLSWAAGNGHEAVVRLLLARADVEINTKDKGVQTPLSWAAKNGHKAVVRLLLARADVEANSKDDYVRRTSLSWAAGNGHEAVVRLLLARADVEINTKDDYMRRTSLSWAAGNGHEAVVRLLLTRADVEINTKDKGGRTSLLWAAGNGHEAVVRLLLARTDVEANCKDKGGRTSLSWAARNGHEAVVRLLLARADVEINTKDKGVRTSLSWAAGNGHEAVVRLLLARTDVEANCKDEGGRTPLSWAARNGHEAVVRLLLARTDVEANFKDDYMGRTPLLWAARNGHEAVIRLLLARADVEANSKDKGGRTPLSWAAENGHEAVIRLLLARADVEANSKDEGGRTPLLWAAENGHEAVVRLLLARADVEANSKDKGGRTPLSWAAENEHEAVIRLLLTRADVETNCKDEGGRTPLLWAARNGHEAVVRLLLTRADVEANFKDDDWGRTPLLWAARNGHEAVIRLLLAQADVEANCKDKGGRTSLSWAARNGHEAVVRLLLARADVEINTKDKGVRTLLSWAAGNGHEAVVRLLLARADVEANFKDDYMGPTPLSWAAENGHEAVIRLLLARADVETNCKDEGGRTPLLWAARNGHEAVIRLLLAQADVEANCKDKGGRTSLSWAARNGHEAVVRLLLARADVEINTKDKGVRTSLSWAAGNGHEAVVRLLLARADVEANFKDDYMGPTPLSWAAENGHEAVIRLLLARADVETNCKDEGGRTPLLWAARNGHEAVVRLLLTRADVEANFKDDDWGRTPLLWAARNGHEAVIRLLLAQADVEANCKDKGGRTPLLWAAENGHEAVVRLLLTRADVEANSKDDDWGRTPLLWAARNGHEAVIRLLLARADVEANSKDKGGRTPLLWAAENGHEAVVRLLLARADVEANSKDDDWGRTPLLWAAENGHEAVVRLLQSHDSQSS